MIRTWSFFTVHSNFCIQPQSQSVRVRVFFVDLNIKADDMIQTLVSQPSSATKIPPTLLRSALENARQTCDVMRITMFTELVLLEKEEEEEGGVVCVTACLQLTRSRQTRRQLTMLHIRRHGTGTTTTSHQTVRTQTERQRDRGDRRDT